MKKSFISIIVCVLAVFVLINFPAAAADKTVLDIKLKLPENPSEWTVPGELCITRQGLMPSEVSSEKEMAIIQFFQKDTDIFRIGIKEIFSPGLLVRADLKTSEVKNGELSIQLKKSGEKWKMFANGREVNNINWNISIPEGKTAEEFRKTDNIYFCTDYSLPNEATAQTFEDNNGVIEFFENFPKIIDVNISPNSMQFEILDVKGENIARASETQPPPQETESTTVQAKEQTDTVSKTEIKTPKKAPSAKDVGKSGKTAAASENSVKESSKGSSATVAEATVQASSADTGETGATGENTQVSEEGDKKQASSIDQSKDIDKKDDIVQNKGEDKSQAINKSEEDAGDKSSLRLIVPMGSISLITVAVVLVLILRKKRNKA